MLYIGQLQCIHVFILKRKAIFLFITAHHLTHISVRYVPYFLASFSPFNNRSVRTRDERCNERMERISFLHLCCWRDEYVSERSTSWGFSSRDIIEAYRSSISFAVLYSSPYLYWALFCLALEVTFVGSILVDDTGSPRCFSLREVALQLPKPTWVIDPDRIWSLYILSRCDSTRLHFFFSTIWCWTSLCCWSVFWCCTFELCPPSANCLLLNSAVIYEIQKITQRISSTAVRLWILCFS